MLRVRRGSQPPGAWWRLVISRVTVLVLVAGLLVAVGVDRAQPASATVGSLNSMTWNIQGSAGQTAWNQIRTTLSTALARHNQDSRRPALNVVALQEVGSRPRGAAATGNTWAGGPWTIQTTPGSVNTITYPGPNPATGAARQFQVDEFTWDVNGTTYYVYYMPMLPSSTAPAGSTAARNGLAIISDQQATNVWFEQPQRWRNTAQSVSPNSRPAFGIQYPDGSAWWTVHSASGPSDSTRNDASNMVTAISNRMNTAGVGNWAVLGDFNRDLIHLGVNGFGTLPAGAHIVNPVARRGPRSSSFDPQVTRPSSGTSSGTQLDYMITNDMTAGLQAQTYGNYSDHLAVQFGTSLMAAGEVGQINLLTQPGRCLDLDSGTGPIGNNTRLRLASCAGGSSTQRWAVNDDGTITNGGYCLDNYGGGTADGNSIGLWTCNGGGNQQWAAYTDGQIYNLPVGAPKGSGKCLDTTAPSNYPPPPAGASPGMSLRTCSTGSTQLFHFQYQDPPAASGALELGDVMQGCLDHGQSQLTAQACSGGGTDQVWTLPGDGTVRVGPPGSTGQCLDNSGGGTGNGNHVVLWSCNSPGSQDNQTWQPRADGSLYNPASGRCLNNGAQDSAGLTIQDCYTGEPGQIWNFNADTATITQPALRMCLDHFLSGNGARARVWECTPQNANQQWTLFSDGTVRDGSPGRCLQNSGGSNTAGNPIIMTTCSGGSSQLWQLRVDGTLYNPATGMCVVNAHGPGPGNRVTLEPCASTTNWQPVGSALQANESGPSCLARPANTLTLVACTPGERSQQWTLPGDGTVRVGPPGSTGQCLDNWDGGTGNGNHVVLWSCHNPGSQDNQTWQPRADGSLYNPASGKCLNNDAHDSSTGLTIQDCYTDEPGQIWNISGSAITQPPMPMCLQHFLSGNAVAARQWECIPGNSYQQWTQPGDGTLREGTSGNTGRCLDDYNNGSNDGNPVILYDCRSGATNQQWQEFSDGSLYNPPTGKCAGVGDSRAIGAAFTLMPCVAALHWYLVSSQDQ